MRPPRAHFRDTRHYVLAAAMAQLAPVLRPAARAFTGAPTAPTTWRRGLVVSHGHIGDVLCQTCSLDLLAEGLPGCEWSYLTTPAGAQVLHGNPAVAQILASMHGDHIDALDRDTFRELRAAGFDAVVCANTVREHESIRLALRLRAPNRVGFAHRGFAGLITHEVRTPGPRSAAVLSRYLAEQLTGMQARRELRPQIFFAPEDAAAADAEWQRLGLAGPGPVLACSPGTRQALNRVPPSFFGRVLRHVLELDPEVRVVLCGLAEERSLLRAVQDCLPRPVPMAVGNLTLRGFAALLRRCTLLFTMDSGPRHLANAVFTPVVFVRNMAARQIDGVAYCATEWDVAPDGDFLSAAAIERALDHVDATAVARRIITGVRERLAQAVHPPAAYHAVRGSVASC